MLITITHFLYIFYFYTYKMKISLFNANHEKKKNNTFIKKIVSYNDRFRTYCALRNGKRNGISKIINIYYICVCVYLI